MSFVTASVSTAALLVGGAVVGGALYLQDQQRKAMHQQQDALRAAQEADKREKAKAEVDAQVSANAQMAAVRRRRRESALQLGTTSNALGGSATALGAGSPAVQIASKPAGTALGAGGM